MEWRHNLLSAQVNQERNENIWRDYRYKNLHHHYIMQKYGITRGTLMRIITWRTKKLITGKHPVYEGKDYGFRVNGHQSRVQQEPDGAGTQAGEAALSGNTSEQGLLDI